MHIVRTDDNTVTIFSAREALSLLHLFVALSVHVDVLPSALAYERQVIRLGPHNRTIFLMQFLNITCSLAEHNEDCSMEVTRRSKFRAWKLAQTVKVDIVDAERA
jgi:hypothetical protein